MVLNPLDPAGLQGLVRVLVQNELQAMQARVAAAEKAASAARLAVVNFHAPAVTPLVWTAQPAAATLLFNVVSAIIKIDLTAFTQCRLRVINAVAGFAGAYLQLIYSTTYQTAAASFLQLSDSGQPDTATILPINSQFTTPWCTINKNARSDVFVAVQGVGGNAVISPSLRLVQAQFQ